MRLYSVFIKSKSCITGACAQAVCAFLWALFDRLFVSGAFGAAHLHRLAGLYSDSRDGCNCSFWSVHSFKNQSGRTGLEKGNVYRAGNCRENLICFPGMAYHATASVSQTPSIASQMDAACQPVSIDKSIYADGVIPDL